MKYLDTTLEAYDIHFDRNRGCEDCPYNDIDDCINEITYDLYKRAKRLKEENDRLIKCRDSENNKDEVIKYLSDTNKDLLKYIHELKEDSKLLKEENKKLMIQLFRSQQYK